MAPLKPGPNPSPPRKSTHNYICPKCRKDYGNNFGLWFSSKMIGIYRIKYICKMCGNIWFKEGY